MKAGLFWIGVAIFALALALSAYAPPVPKISQFMDDVHELRVKLPEIQATVTSIQASLKKLEGRFDFFSEQYEHDQRTAGRRQHP